MLQTLARYRAVRYLAYAAAFVLGMSVAFWQSLLTCWDAWTADMAYEWRSFCALVCEIEDSYKLKPLAEADFEDTLDQWEDGDVPFFLALRMAHAKYGDPDGVTGKLACDKAPDGWKCIGEPGHPGPCAAVLAHEDPSSKPRIAFSDGLYLGLQQQGVYARYVPIPGAAAEAKRLVGESIPDDARSVTWIHTPPPWHDVRGDGEGIWAAKWFVKPQEVALA